MVDKSEVEQLHVGCRSLPTKLFIKTMRLKKDNSNEGSSFRLHRDDGSKKPTRYYSDKQEKSVAKAIGGRQTANSGATAYQKGDVTDDKWLIECKTCMKDQKSFTMHEEWFDKNRSESIFMKKDYTAVVFNFGPGKQNYYCIDEYTFLEMKEALEEKRRNDMQNL